MMSTCKKPLHCIVIVIPAPMSVLDQFNASWLSQGVSEKDGIYLVVLGMGSGDHGGDSFGQ